MYEESSAVLKESRISNNNLDYIYILIFKNKPYYKIGISSNNINRVIVHNKQNEIDFSKSLFFSSKSKNIKVLERLLLTIIPFEEYKDFEHPDGKSEIRNIDTLNVCLDTINIFEKKLNLTKENFKFQRNIKPFQKSTINIEKNDTQILSENNQKIKIIFFTIKELFEYKTPTVTDKDIYYQFIFENSTREDKRLYDLILKCEAFLYKNNSNTFRLGWTKIEGDKINKNISIDFIKINKDDLFFINREGREYYDNILDMICSKINIA